MEKLIAQPSLCSPRLSTTHSPLVSALVFGADGGGLCAGSISLLILFRLLRFFSKPWAFAVCVCCVCAR